MSTVNPELEFAFQCPVCTLLSISRFVELTARHRIEFPLDLWETPRSVYARDSDKCRNTITSDIGDDSISTCVMRRNIFNLENATNTKYLEMQLFWGLGGCDFPQKCVHDNSWTSNNYSVRPEVQTQIPWKVLAESNSSCSRISDLGQGLDCTEVRTKVTACLGLPWSGAANSRQPTISDVTREPVPAPQSQIFQNRESIPDLFSFDFDIVYRQPVFLIMKFIGAHKNCRHGNNCQLIHKLVFEISKLNQMCHNRIKFS